MVLEGEVTATASVSSTELQGVHGPFATSAKAIDVVVRWGDWIMMARELSPPRSFFVGEDNCDVTLPAEMVGAPKVPVLLARWDGEVRLIIPSAARVLIGGQNKRMTAARAIARGVAQPSSTIRDAAEVVLLPEQTATLYFGTVAIEFRASEAAPRMPRERVFEKRAVRWYFASFVLHASLLGALVFFHPPKSPEDEGMSDDQRYDLQQRLQRLEEKDFDLQWERRAYEWRARRNARRRQAELEAQPNAWWDSIGAAGSGWTDERIAEARREEASRDEGSAQGDRSLIGVLYDWPAPASTTQPAARVSPSNFSTVTVQGDARAGNRRGPQVRMGAVTVSGRLPPEVIQRIVRQNFGRFRLCYENGLRNNPVLQGQVAVRFVIGRDGAISNVGNAGSDLPDSAVASCVVRSFQTMTFPQPEGGIVTVVYRIVFSPGG